MRKILLVAFHFPPIQGSSGVHRTLAFARHLPEFGWEPTVLSVDPRAYRSVASGSDAAEGIPVVRTWALDATRHLAIRGRHLGLSRLPDPWSTWTLSAIPRGLQLIRRDRPSLIFATCPIPTALVIGAALHRLTGIPWVADFRDPVSEDDDPNVTSGLHGKLLRSIERAAVRTSDQIILTAPSAQALYRARYPEIPGSRFAVIENGYDESAFSGLHGEPAPPVGRPLIIVHSGTLYPYARNPTALFDALDDLKRAGLIDERRVRFVFRAAGHEEFHRSMVAERNLSDVVAFLPAVPYRDALQEMLEADGLLILQAANSNYQIPAKLYEYMRAGRPILALTDKHGDTAIVLRRAGVTSIADLESTASIRKEIPQFLKAVAERNVSIPEGGYVLTCNRKNRARDLALILDRLTR